MHTVNSSLPTKSEQMSMPQPAYLHIEVREDTLKRLLSQQALHADELYCADQQSKQVLNSLLLSLLLEK